MNKSKLDRAGFKRAVGLKLAPVADRLIYYVHVANKFGNAEYIDRRRNEALLSIYPRINRTFNKTLKLHS